ncbi:thioesterase II family protein [Streptomyces kebangsaanensis]|uniref:thioesterase II family protein n=1 Tax=Streptomyces kebangsaanensis TaxID=864058 RepID=UPI00093BF9F7|nr:thioesterase domain-containing protein [Streptomyces kebangsaanensis]
MNAVKSTSPRWFLTPPSKEAEVRLFCFPYSGCGASMFRNWPTRIGPAEVVPLQLPGRENRTREPHFGTYEELADQLVAGIAEHLDRPYAVFGHCGGALPAFESVIRIVERGLRPPERVFVSSQVAPQDGPYGRFLGLDETGLRAELIALLAALGAAEPPEEILDLYLEVLVADVEANKKYRKDAAGSLPCAVTELGWDADVEVPHALMGGWADWVAEGAARKEILDGTHYTFLDAPADLVACLARDLTAMA